MREGPLLQSLHFNSVLVDTWNVTGAVGLGERQTGNVAANLCVWRLTCVYGG
jgi:hypothetical protein